MQAARVPTRASGRCQAVGLLLAFALVPRASLQPGPRTQEALSSRTIELRCSQALELEGRSQGVPGSPGLDPAAILAQLEETRSLAFRRQVQEGSGEDAQVRLSFAGAGQCVSERTVDLDQAGTGPFVLEAPDPSDDDVALAGRTLEWTPTDPRKTLREVGRETDDSSFALLASEERLAAALDALERLTRPGQRRTRVDPEVVATLLAPHAIGSLEPRAVGPWVLDPPRISDLLLGQLDGSLELVEEPATAAAPKAARTFRLTGWIEAAPRRDVEVTSDPGAWSGSELRWRARWLRTVRLHVTGEVRRGAAGTEGLSWRLRSDVQCACEQELGVPMLAIELALRWSGSLSSEGEANPQPR